MKYVVTTRGAAITGSFSSNQSMKEVLSLKKDEDLFAPSRSALARVGAFIML